MTNGNNAEGTIPPNYQLELAAQRKELVRISELLTASKPEPDDEDVIDLREYWNVLVRRKQTIFTVVAVALVVALLYTFLATPIYRSTLLLQIEREDSKVLEFQNITPEESVNAKDFYETQYELLKSRTLARRVIDQLGLESSPSFAPDDEESHLKGLATTLKGWLSGGESDDVENGPDLEEIFLENLTVSPVKNSRLVRVSFDSPDPEEAAAITNAVADNFISTSLERRFDASSYAKVFLDEQIQQVRANLEDSERRLVVYAREREIVNLEDRLEILLQKLKEMNSELIKAEAERIQAEAEYQELLETGAYSATPVLDSLLIQKLKERKAERL